MVEVDARRKRFRNPDSFSSLLLGVARVIYVDFVLIMTLCSQLNPSTIR
jgi:hypothetical protein